MATEVDELDRLYEALMIEGKLVDCQTPNVFWRNRFFSLWARWPLNFPDSFPKDMEYRNTEGRLHRIYGPAYVSTHYKVEEWYKDGELHRVNGPARTHKDSKWYYVDGKLHRLDGPAVDAKGHPKQYWIGGQKLSPKEYKKEIERRKRKGLIK